MTAAVIFIFAACTIAPHDVPSHHASIGQSGKADSGIHEITPAGWEVDAHFRDRYNAMIATYGTDPQFQPALVKDQGVTEIAGLIYFDREAMRRFLLLNEWRRMGRPAPTKPFLDRILPFRTSAPALRSPAPQIPTPARGLVSGEPLNLRA